MPEFGELVRQERVKRNLRFGGLARLLFDRDATPRQISRMAQRLVDVERRGLRHNGLVAQLIRVLHLDAALVSDILTAEKAREDEQRRTWSDEPIDPAMHIRAIPGVWITKRLAGVSTAEALTIASEFARDKGLVVCLAVDRRLSIWFDQHGQEYAHVPTTAEDQPKVHSIIGGHRLAFEDVE